MSETLSKIGLVAIILLVGFLAGVKVQDWRFNAGEKAKLEKAIETERAEVKRLNELSYGIGMALARETQSRAEDARKYRGEIESWKRKGVVYVECPGGQGFKPVAESSVSFDAGFIDLWNGGLCLAVPEREREACRSGGVDGAGAASGSAVTPSRLLSNNEENAKRWGECITRLDGIQSWALGAGLIPGGSR